VTVKVVPVHKDGKANNFLTSPEILHGCGTQISDHVQKIKILRALCLLTK